ncbi:MAG: ABC transporter ATP-binding protein [Thermoanaerobaculia bacterium]
MTEDMIRVESVSKSYGRFGRPTRALVGVSLEVPRGETLGLIGPNGAGKTTLLSCLLGFLRPDAGTIRVDGMAPDDLAVRRRTGYMPERLGFDRDLSGAAFLGHHWRLAGGDPRRTREEVEQAAQRVGLPEEALRRKLRGYSRGMLQRIGVAQATLGAPDLLFLDEPASGTDPLGVAVVRDRIVEAKQRGATIVLNSHQLAEVEKVCDRVLFIEGGRLTREEVLRGAAATRRRAFLRVPPGQAAAAAEILRRAGLEAVTGPDGTLRLAGGGEEDLSRAVRVLAVADVAVLEARASADLESLFHERGNV